MGGVALGQVVDIGHPGTCRQLLKVQVVVCVRVVRELDGGAQRLLRVVVEGRPLRMHPLDLLGNSRFVAVDRILDQIHACRHACDGLGAVHLLDRLLELAADLLVGYARYLALLVVSQVA